MKQIYLSATWKLRESARLIAEEMELFGLYVKSSWLYVPDGDDEKYLREQAYTDLREVRECDVFVRLSDGKSGGKMCETGLALAWGKPIYVVGGRQMIFDYLPHIIHVKDKNHLIRELCHYWIN
jgi:nucleoside 2-deoxyribosyltransferase